MHGEAPKLNSLQNKAQDILTNEDLVGNVRFHRGGNTKRNVM
jgi:hypothetical protein